jgi:hypothetical protein
MNDLIQCKGKDCKVRCLLPTCEIKDVGGCYHKCTFRDAMEAGKIAYQQKQTQFVYKPLVEDEPLAVDVKVGYRFASMGDVHKSKDCSRYQYLISPKSRKRLHRKAVGDDTCPPHDGVAILNDDWVINLRGPKLPVIKMKRSVRNR